MIQNGYYYLIGTQTKCTSFKKMSPVPTWLKQSGTFLQKWYLFLSCSPLLARLEKKCQSKEEITEEDFASEEGIMGNKIILNIEQKILKVLLMLSL